MPNRHFNLIFKGEISPNFDISEVKKNISILLKTDLAKVEAMLNRSNPVILKKNVTETDAYNYKEIFDKTGALSIVVPSVETENQIGPAPQSSAPGLESCQKCGAMLEKGPNCVVCDAALTGNCNDVEKNGSWEKSGGLEDIFTQLATNKIHDPVAQRTSWVGINNGGTMCSHRLIQTASGRFEFRATKSYKSLYLAFLCIGATLVLFTFSNIGKYGLYSSNTATGLIIGSGFMIFGACSLAGLRRPVAVFDMASCRFWRRKESGGAATTTEASGFIRLQDVYALQIIPVYQSTFQEGSVLTQFGKMQLMYGYELNLVLKNGEKVCVVNHGDRNKLCEDAAIISKVIGKPVWDAVDVIQEYIESNLNNDEGRLALGAMTLKGMVRGRQGSRRHSC